MLLAESLSRRSLVFISRASGSLLMVFSRRFLFFRDCVLAAAMCLQNIAVVGTVPLWSSAEFSFWSSLPFLGGY